VVCCMAWPMDT